MKFFSTDPQKKSDEVLLIKLMALFLYIFLVGVISEKIFEALFGKVNKSESDMLWIQYVIILISSVPRVIRSSYKKVLLLAGIVSIIVTFGLLAFERMVQ